MRNQVNSGSSNILRCVKIYIRSIPQVCVKSMGPATKVHLQALRGTISKEIGISLSIFVLAFLVRIRDINRPFTEYFRYINCQYAVYARNYIRYGYLKTKFGFVSTPYHVQGSGFNYYFHHPLLLVSGYPYSSKSLVLMKPVSV